MACDAALRMGATRGGSSAGPSLPMTYWPHVTRARAAVEAADGGAQNVGESLLRLMVLELGIGRPETQYVVTRGRAAPRWTCGSGGTCSSSTAG